MSTYLIDIDGVICSKGHGGNYRAAQRNPRVVAKMHELVAEGHHIILYTSRLLAQPKKKKELRVLTLLQLGAWDVPYHEIKFNKPESDFIVDDKCVDVETWLSE